MNRNNEPIFRPFIQQFFRERNELFPILYPTMASALLNRRYRSYAKSGVVYATKNIDTGGDGKCRKPVLA